MDQIMCCICGQPVRGKGKFWAYDLEGQSEVGPDCHKRLVAAGVNGLHGQLAHYWDAKFDPDEYDLDTLTARGKPIGLFVSVHHAVPSDFGLGIKGHTLSRPTEDHPANHWDVHVVFERTSPEKAQQPSVIKSFFDLKATDEVGRLAEVWAEAIADKLAVPFPVTYDRAKSSWIAAKQEQAVSDTPAAPPSKGGDEDVQVVMAQREVYRLQTVELAQQVTLLQEQVAKLRNQGSGGEDPRIQRQFAVIQEERAKADALRAEVERLKAEVDAKDAASGMAELKQEMDVLRVDLALERAEVKRLKDADDGRTGQRPVQPIDEAIIEKVKALEAELRELRAAETQLADDYEQIWTLSLASGRAGAVAHFDTAKLLELLKAKERTQAIKMLEDAGCTLPDIITAQLKLIEGLKGTITKGVAFDATSAKAEIGNLKAQVRRLEAENRKLQPVQHPWFDAVLEYLEENGPVPFRTDDCLREIGQLDDATSERERRAMQMEFGKVMRQVGGWKKTNNIMGYNEDGIWAAMRGWMPKPDWEV